MSATKITIHYDDGTISYANGEDAASVMRWWESCEVMAYVHGANYTGPKMINVKAIDVEPSPEGKKVKNGLMIFDGKTDYIKTQGY